MRNHAPVVFGTLFALVVAACGGGGSKANPQADLALAKGAVLTSSDAPAGYTATPHSSSGDPPEQTKRDFANCLSTDFTFFDDVKGAQKTDGPDLVNKDTDAEIDNSIEIDPKKSEIDKGYNLFQNPNIDECLGKLFDTVVKQAQPSNGSGQATFGTSTVSTFPVDGVGDRGKGFRVVLPFTTPQGQANAYIDFLFVQRGRAGLTLSSQTFGTQPDRATELALVKLMSDRLGQKAP